MLPKRLKNRDDWPWVHENKTCCRDVDTEALANRRGYDVRLLGVIDKQGNSRLVFLLILKYA